MNAQYRSDFGTFGRYGASSRQDDPRPKKAFEFTVKERGEVPGHVDRWPARLV